MDFTWRKLFQYVDFLSAIKVAAGLGSGTGRRHFMSKGTVSRGWDDRRGILLIELVETKLRCSIGNLIDTESAVERRSRSPNDQALTGLGKVFVPLYFVPTRSSRSHLLKSDFLKLSPPNACTCEIHQFWNVHTIKLHMVMHKNFPRTKRGVTSSKNPTLYACITPIAMWQGGMAYSKRGVLLRLAATISTLYTLTFTGFIAVRTCTASYQNTPDNSAGKKL